MIRNLLAFVAGVCYVAAFAPFNFSLLAFICLAGLFYLWMDCVDIKQAFFIGWLFGLGQFGAGVSWMYVSLTTFGGMPGIIAAAAVLILIMGLAIFPALVGVVQQFFKPYPQGLRLMLVVAPVWVLIEWVREWIFTGLPWLAAGYSQTVHILGQLAPAGGVYLVSLAIVMIAASLAWLMIRRSPLCILPVIFIFAASYFIGQLQWSSADGRALSVKLVQGNVSIWDKWNPSKANEILDHYLSLSEQGQDADLIIWPEAAAPVLMRQLPKNFINTITNKSNSYTMFGVVDRDDETRAIYNAVATTQNDGSFAYYRKIQLVPFGEFLPLGFMLQWFIDYLNIPMSNFSKYPVKQAPIDVKGVKIGVSICYEDAFANVIRGSLPQADLLVNVSEDAWFGNSLAPHQRLQMAQMRAIENSRTMVRVSNNGLSALIDHKGIIQQLAPQFKAHVFTISAPVRNGLTLFSLWGHKLVLSLLIAMLGIALIYILFNQKLQSKNSISN